MKNESNREMRSGFVHVENNEMFKVLKKSSKFFRLLEVKARLAVENQSLRTVPESWADIHKEEERQRRMQKIRDAHKRQLAKA